MKREKAIHTILVIIVLLFSVVFLLPLVFSVTNSFKDYNDIIGDFFAMPIKIDFSIYAETWEELDLGQKFANTLLYTLSVTAVCAIVTPMAAYKLGRVRNKMSSVLMILFVIPIMLPFMIYCVPLSALMGKVGLTNTKLGYIIASIGLSIPFDVYVLQSFVQTVPVEIEECARVDGATPMRVFFSVVYPLMRPAIATVSIITAMNTWCDLIVCKILASSSESLQNVQLKLFTRFSSNSSDWTHAFPAIVISMIPSIAFFLIMQKQVINGVASGAVKG